MPSPGCRPGSRGDSSYEKNFSTQPHQTRAHSRIPGSNGHPQRPQSASIPPFEGPGTTDSLNKPPPLTAGNAPPSKVVPGSTGFPRQARLLKPSEFRRVFSGSNRSADGLFTVLIASTEGNLGRLGLAITKKCAKGAVDRNRLKRIVRESFRTHRDMLATFDLIVMCRPKAVKASNADLLASLHKHWKIVNQNRQCAS